MPFGGNLRVDDNFLDNLPAGVVLHDARSAVVGANKLALRLLGCRDHDIVGRIVHDPSWQFVHADGSIMDVNDYPATRVLRDGVPVTDLVVGVKLACDPAVRWLICNGYPVFDRHGAVRSAVICFTDCSELKRTQQALEQSEQRLQLVLRGSNDASWDWDLAHERLYYSPRWWDMIGYDADAMPATPSLWERLLHPDDAVRVRTFVDHIVRSGSESYAIEFSLRHREGHYVPVLSKGFVVRDGAGKALRIAGTNTDLTERKQWEHRLLVTANHDLLTGLPNRRYLTEALAQAMGRATRSSTRGAVVMIDLDDFKLLNDSEGHDMGDLLLQQVGARLQAALRVGDFVGRLGGDEFVVIMASHASTALLACAEAESVCLKLRDALARPYVLRGGLHNVTPSMGATLFDAATESTEIVFKQADIALYAAKSAGRNTLRFFDPAMQHAVKERVLLQAQLTLAVGAGQLELYFQPQFDLARRVIGAEALLRWHHPTRGLLAPGAFIDLAETTGLILPIGHWVLEQASLRLAAWARDPALAHLTLAVNVSARQLHQDGFVQQALGALASAGANPARLEMELTESLLASDVEDAIAKMRALQLCGVNFSIDDFGTGFSSLRYIHRFPLRCLKIDQSFVAQCDSDANAAAIVEIVIALASKLGLDHVAEGVETASQLAFLAALGCSAFQGYLLSPPLPAHQFEALARAPLA